EWLFEGRAGRGEQLGAVGGYDHVVFQADTELATDVNAGFVAEGHAGRERQGVAAHQVGPLVAVHADAVAQAMGEVLVAGGEAGVADELARGRVHGFARRTRLRRLERRLLRALDDFKDAQHLVPQLAVPCFAEHEGARDVGLVAFHVATAVNHQDRAFANDLGREGTVRQRGVRPYLNAGSAAEAQAAVRFRDEFFHVALGHAFPQRAPCGFVGFEGDLRGQAHQLEFVRVLDHAAAGGHGRGANQLERGGGFGDAVGENEFDGLLDSQCAAADAAVAEAAADERVRVVVLFPGEDLRVAGERSGFELLLQAALFKRGGDEEGVTFDGEHQRSQALAIPPAEAGVVEERGAADHKNGVDTVRFHERPGFLQACLALLVGDGTSALAQGLQRGDRGGNVPALCKRRGRRGSSGFDERGAGNGGAGPKEVAAGRHGPPVAFTKPGRVQQYLAWMRQSRPAEGGCARILTRPPRRRLTKALSSRPI